MALVEERRAALVLALLVVAIGGLPACAGRSGTRSHAATAKATAPAVTEADIETATTVVPPTSARPATTTTPGVTTTVAARTTPPRTSAPDTNASPLRVGDAHHPNPALSPGAVFAGVTRQQVCTVGYSASVRNVPQSLKDRVYAEYGISSHRAGSYEVDHLISLELGGSNDMRNLWPEPYGGADGARSKDGVENHLHAEVCSGVITLAAAQIDIVHWDGIIVSGTRSPPALPALVVLPRRPSGLSYRNCTVARAAGAAPMRRGQPGYRPALDRDGDGVACE